MSKDKHDWPEPGEVIAMAKEHDSLRSLARALGKPSSSVHSFLDREGIWEMCRAALKKSKGGGERDSSAPLGHDVTTQEGRSEANKEAELKFLRKEYKKLQEHLLNQENLVERIVSASTRPLERPPFRIRARARDEDKPSRDLILPIFDAQYGQRVVPQDTVNGVGKFNSSIFADRMELYVEKVCRLMRNYAGGHHIDNLIFALGGDMVEGDEIFRGQEWHLDLHPADQLLGIRDLLAYAIDAIMEAGAEIGVKSANILCVPGNHGKVGGKKGGARPPQYSWDYIAFKLLEERMANHPINLFAIEPAGTCYFEVKGNVFGMLHGDEVKGWGGLPFYGITRHDAKMIRTANVIPDYVLLGHHHQPASIPVGYGEWLMSGNWVGGNNLSRFVGSNTPSQWCFGVSERHGVCDRFLIYLDDKRKPEATIHGVGE